MSIEVIIEQDVIEDDEVGDDTVKNGGATEAPNNTSSIADFGATLVETVQKVAIDAGIDVTIKEAETTTVTLASLLEDTEEEGTSLPDNGRDDDETNSYNAPLIAGVAGALTLALVVFVWRKRHHWHAEEAKRATVHVEKAAPCEPSASMDNTVEGRGVVVTTVTKSNDAGRAEVNV